MKKLALIYHSAHGHTEHIARQVADGARAVADTQVDLLKAQEVAHAPEDLVGYDGVIFGSPTFLGGVSAEQAANRLGSWSGLMAQAGHQAPADAFAPGDIKTARMFGENFAQALQQAAEATP